MKGAGPAIGLLLGLLVFCGCGGLLIARGFGLRPGGSAYHDLLMADRRRQAAYRQAESIAKAARSYAAAHGQALPGPQAFRQKLQSYIGPEAAEFDGFDWEFTGGSFTSDHAPIGRIHLEDGDVVADLDGTTEWVPKKGKL